MASIAADRHNTTAAHLQNLIATDAPDARQWTCCFLNEQGRPILGIKPDSDTGEQQRIASSVVGETEIHLVKQTFVRHANKQSLNRPIIGGIQIRVSDAQGTAAGTAGIVVNRNDDIGVITAGHVVGTINATVYQPRQSDMNNWEIGRATRISDYLNQARSDSAFVKLNTDISSTERRIWKSSNTQYTVADTGTVQLGDTVYMQGAATAQTERTGRICSVNATVRFEDGGVLTHQYLATYLTRVGDSGAPVYAKGVDPEVTLIGINVGGTEIQDIQAGAPNTNTYPANGDSRYAVISQWENVLLDLFG